MGDRRLWTVEMDPGRARDMGAMGIPEGSAIPIVLTVEVVEEELLALYRAALTSKGGKAKGGAVVVTRGRHRG